MRDPVTRTLSVALLLTFPLACVIETEPSTVAKRPLLRDTLRARASASAAASVAPPPEEAPLPTPPPLADAFRACDTDADCVAVLPNGCCHDGRNIALRKSLLDPYRATFSCPTDKPRCPMHLVLDPRVATCDVSAHLCSLVDPPGNDAGH